MRYAKIKGTGAYVPARVLTNDDLSRMLGENINDFVSNIVGINERHVCADDESTADLATEAARLALRSSNLAPEDLDLIILATDTPEYLSPATSVVVQDRLGARNAGTFDVNCACAGFVTALDTATKYVIADEAYRNVLVVGAYAMSKYVDWTEKKTSTIFADGAGAVVVQASEESPGFLGAKLVADGRYHDHMGVYAGGTHMPIDERVLAENFYTKVRFAKKYPPEVNIEGWQRIVGEVLDKCKLTTDDVSLFLFTQVNLSTIKIVMEAMRLPMSRTHTVMGKWGYTGSACIPMVLDDAVREGKLERGQIVVMCASGGGLNMACAAFRF
ncbi:MAG: 3-oxoacyl-[acyl-carrier-protein] synthase [Pyrinomonadaceae bacterium]|jgi:3-oxoacyl-[acyl-carrier-protein] synthase-3|nr:3-oxoacyl-[acyl-carrier-protein] synthase [Pyrinomonadaceae bacterium]